MKKIFLLCAACFFATGLSFAGLNDTPESGFSFIRRGSIVKVLYKSDKIRTVTVSIFDSNQKKIFSETLKNQKGFLRPYNLEKLACGDYTVELSDGDSVDRHTVRLVNPQPGRTFNVTRVAGSLDKVMFTIAKSALSFNVKILDQKGSVIYKDDQMISEDFGRIFNLERIKGEVSIIVTDAHGNSEKFVF
jgi:hypothetical protein